MLQVARSGPTRDATHAMSPLAIDWLPIGVVFGVTVAAIVAIKIVEHLSVAWARRTQNAVRGIDASE
jgi:hypothetical protein